MRKALAALVAAVALGAAVYFGSLHLGAYRAGNCSEHGISDLMFCFHRTRATWQYPVATVIASLGLAGAAGVLKRT